MDPTESALVFDVAAILGIGSPTADPLPEPNPGFITLRIPEGMSLMALRESDAGKKLMNFKTWYSKYPWSRDALPAGVYRLRVPAWEETRYVGEKLGNPGERLATVALVVAAHLCIRLQGATHPLSSHASRCAELMEFGNAGVEFESGGPNPNDPPDLAPFAYGGLSVFESGTNYRYVWMS